MKPRNAADSDRAEPVLGDAPSMGRCTRATDIRYRKMSTSRQGDERLELENTA
jgi:hypothetical protein